MAEFVWPPNSGSAPGTVIGPGSSTDNAVARFNGITGESIQNSGVIIDDSDNITGVASITVDGLTADRAVVTDGTKKLASSATTATELGYVSGVTSAIQTQLNDKLDDSQRGAPNGVASLDAGGKVPQSELPAIAITDTFVVASQAAMLALSAETGDIAVRTDLNKTFILAGSDPTILANWQELLTPTDTVLSVNGQTGAVTLSTSDISEGTNLYYTDERAQDAVGTILTDTNDIDLTYTDGTPSITADLRSSSITAKTEVTADIADYLMISDTSDSGNLKKADLGDFLLPSATQVVTNKDIDGGTASNTSRLTVPKDTYANLLTLTRKEGTLLYATDLDTFFADDGTNLTAVGSGSGSGSGTLNIVDNPSAASATTGWTAATNYTVTRDTTNSPLAGVIDTCFAISTTTASSESSTSGVYAASLAMPSALRNTKTQVSLYVTVPASSLGVWRLSIYNASGTRMSLSSDSSSVTTLPAGFTGQFVCTFDADSSATYTISLTQTTRSSANTLYVTNISIGNGITAQGAAVSEWQSYTPTGSWVTNVTYTGKWRRVGDSMEVMANVDCSGAPTAADLTINLPSGYTIDTNKLANTSVGRATLGSGQAVDGGVRGYPLIVIYGTTTSITFRSAETTGSSGSAVDNDAPFTFGSGDCVSACFIVPIAEWSGNGTVNLGQGAQVTYIADDGSSDVFGPNGSLVPNVAFGTGTTTRIVSPPLNSQNMDYDLEINYRGAGWSKAGSLFPPFQGNNSSSSNVYGVQGVWTGASSYSIIFGNRGVSVAASNVNDGNASWASENAAGTRFRLVAANPSAPVGFGLAGTDGSSGLYKAGQAPGITTGATIGAGYVGEQLTGTMNSDTSRSSGSAFNYGSVTLLPGVYLILGQGSVEGAGGSTPAAHLVSISTTSATSDTAAIGSGFNNVSNSTSRAQVSRIVNISSSTTYYLVGTVVFSGGTQTSKQTTSYINAIRIA